MKYRGKSFRQTSFDKSKEFKESFRISWQNIFWKRSSSRMKFAEGTWDEYQIPMCQPKEEHLLHRDRAFLYETYSGRKNSFPRYAQGRIFRCIRVGNKWNRWRCLYDRNLTGNPIFRPRIHEIWQWVVDLVYALGATKFHLKSRQATIGNGAAHKIGQWTSGSFAQVFACSFL